jgi:hypothetical protein
MPHKLLFPLHSENFDIVFYNSMSYHQPLSLNALNSHQDFDPDFIAAIITRALNDKLKQIVLDSG